MKPINIISYLDGSPGHEKQTEGVLNALRGLTGIQVLQETVSPVSLSKAAGNWLRYAASFLRIAARRKTSPPADLAIGTGTRTHLPMIFRKRQSGLKIITCMTPDRLLISNFDLCFVPLHDNPKPASNIFTTIGPPNTSRFENRHDPGKGLILIGGIDRKSHDWDSRFTLHQVADIVDRHEDLEWTISSSPRTPGETIRLLSDLSRQRANTTFFPSSETPPGWIEEAYARNKTVWVTADSVSMVYEALTAGCQVGVLPVKWKHPSNKFQKSIDFLMDSGRLVSYEKWLVQQQMASGPVLNEAARCAGEILRRWWPDRLQ